ncbi:hypothetical protein [Natronorubrum sp. FCH18a]|uniref:hypothetical protein n=1 Tax=Natronorubrum sp. FCH18a TaxID=3447018 RepID=UPI003F5185EF
MVDRVSVDANRATRVATTIEEAENAFDFELDVLEEYCESEPSVPLVLDVRTNPDVAWPGFPPY